MATARMAFAMRAPALMGSSFPWPGAAIDLNFAAQRYWWGGAEKTTANFTTYVLNGSTFGAAGLTPTDTIDVTLALAGLGTFMPGSMAAAYTVASIPATTRDFVNLDDGTLNNRAFPRQNINANLLSHVYSAGTAQGQLIHANGNTVGKHGWAQSYATNLFDGSVDGGAVASDTVGTLPAGLTTLRIGRAVGSQAGTLAIGRVLIFTSTKTAAQCQTLATDLKNA